MYRIKQNIDNIRQKIARHSFYVTNSPCSDVAIVDDQS